MPPIPLPVKASKSYASAASEGGLHQLLQKDISLRPLWGIKEKKGLYEQLPVLLGAGLPVLDALGVVAEQYRKQARRQATLVQLRQALEAGQSLSEAMAQQPTHFSAFEVAAIRIGEASGSLGTILQEIGKSYTLRLALQRKLIQIATYPAVVIVIALGVVGFMLTQVIPMFEDIFRQFHAELPKLTQVVLALSVGVRAHGLWLLLVVGACIGSIALARRTLIFRRYSSALLLWLPVAGRLLLKIQLARLALVLGILLRMRVRLDEALELTQQMVSFYPLQQCLVRMHHAVTNGGTLYDSIQDDTLLPLMFRQMISVGEKTATLDQMFLNVAQSYEQESDLEISGLTAILEPLLMVVLGALVGIILVSMYLPMFELSRTIR